MADKIITQDPAEPGVDKLNGPTVTNGTIDLSGLSTSGAVANDVVTLTGGVWAPRQPSGNTTASNLGAGSGVFASKVGSDLQFKSLIAGSGITLTATATDITIDSSGGGGAIVILQEQEASGVASGTFTLGAWRTRVLNTEVADTGGNCVLVANQFTLLAGTYRCMIRCPAFSTINHQSRLRNITDAATTIAGSSALAISSGQSDSWVIGRFTIAASKLFEVQHQANTTRATDGFGVPSSFGENEVYCQAIFWKE